MLYLIIFKIEKDSNFVIFIIEIERYSRVFRINIWKLRIATYDRCQLFGINILRVINERDHHRFRFLFLTCRLFFKDGFELT